MLHSIRFPENLTEIIIRSKISLSIYSVSFDAQGGSAVSPLSNTWYQYVSLPSSTRNGYVLEEWNAKSDGSGASFEVGESYAVADPVTPTLYAIWRPSFDLSLQKELLTTGKISTGDTVTYKFTITNEETTNSWDIDVYKIGILDIADDDILIPGVPGDQVVTSNPGIYCGYEGPSNDTNVINDYGPWIGQYTDTNVIECEIDNLGMLAPQSSISFSIDFTANNDFVDGVRNSAILYDEDDIEAEVGDIMTTAVAGGDVLALPINNISYAEYAYTPPSSSPRSGSSINYACTDPTATNYNDSQFVRHKPSLCTYTTDTPQPLTPPTDVSDILNSGQCSTNLLITNNMKQGDRDNTYGTYNKATVTQVHLVQQHINRILQSQYNQAAGPVDGIYGPLTKQGVQRLQTALATTLNADLGPAGADGIVGPFTKAAINNSCGTN